MFLTNRERPTSAALRMALNFGLNLKMLSDKIESCNRSLKGSIDSPF